MKKYGIKIMQTFLSETSFEDSVKSLDNRRLNKQLLESRQILKILIKKSKGWSNHPAVVQWRNFEQALYQYAMCAANECNNRGIKTEKNVTALEELSTHLVNKEIIYPYWWENTETKYKVNTTHKARLYIKDPTYYYRYKDFVDTASQMVCCPKCTYFWPSHFNNTLVA